MCRGPGVLLTGPPGSPHCWRPFCSISSAVTISVLAASFSSGGCQHQGQHHRVGADVIGADGVLGQRELVQTALVQRVAAVADGVGSPCRWP